MKPNYEIKDDFAIIKINKNIYSKEVLIQASYIKIENLYIILDEDENYFIVNIKLKEKGDLETETLNFFDELIEAQSYLDQLKRTTDIREKILERALLTQNIENKD